MSVTPHTGQRLPATRIAVTSGKGGVGKTSLTINLAVAMARLGHRVGIFDADFALGNIDVMLGLAPDEHLGAVLDGIRTIEDDRDRRAVWRARHSRRQRACARSPRWTSRAGPVCVTARQGHQPRPRLPALRHGHRHLGQRARRRGARRLRAGRDVVRSGRGRRRLRDDQAHQRRRSGQADRRRRQLDARCRRSAASSSARFRSRRIGFWAARFATTVTCSKIGPSRTRCSRSGRSSDSESSGAASRCIRRLAYRLISARPSGSRSLACPAR